LSAGQLLKIGDFRCRRRRFLPARRAVYAAQERYQMTEMPMTLRTGSGATLTVLLNRIMAAAN
jgi:hypothetical protein